MSLLENEQQYKHNPDIINIMIIIFPMVIKLSKQIQALCDPDCISTFIKRFIWTEILNTKLNDNDQNFIIDGLHVP